MSDFVDHVLNWRSKSDDKPVAFRGQAFNGWETRPKIFRAEVGLYDYEKNSVRDLISVHPQEFRDDETMFDKLVRMQHFELPTRLLDVTSNPLVALYFATSSYIDDDEEQDGKVQAFFIPEDRQRYFDSDRVSCMANIANLTAQEKRAISSAYRLPRAEFNKHKAVERLLWFVRIEKPHFVANIDPNDLKLPVYVKPKMSNRRIIAQSGSFIIFGQRKIRSPVIDEGLEVRRVMIPADKKIPIREELEFLGIHAGSLFPEIDKAAAVIVKRYQNML